MKYTYLARSQKGELQTGIIDALDEDTALRNLQIQGLVVIRLKSAEKMPIVFKKVNLWQRVKAKDIYVFFRQLSIFVDANVPLVQSLRTLSQQMRSDFFKETLFAIANDVDSGTSLSKAFAKYPKIFSPFAVNMIKSGEVSGRLQESLNYLADYLEKRHYLTMKVRGAMFYPGFILFTFLVIGILIMTIVMPNLISVLTETGQKLPWTTLIIIFISNFLIKWWWALLIITVGGIAALYRFIRTISGRHFWDHLKLKIPIFGNIFQKTYLSQFADSLSALVKGGVSIIQALDVAGQVTNNVIYQEAIFKTRDEVKVGKTISSELAKHKEFTPLFVQMTSTGEKTGKLEIILEKVAGFYSKEVDNIVDNLSKLIEPILLIVLAIGVAILVAAVFMPIYNLVGGM